jgi:hypothetical protein
MKKSTIVLVATGGFGLFVALVAILSMLLFSKGDGLPASPAKVYETINDMSEEEQEKTVLALTRYPDNDPRAKEAEDVLRRMMKDTKVTPTGRAAAITALAAKKDWQFLPDLAECLYDDENFVIRQAAINACRQVLSVYFPYEPGSSPEDRRPGADKYKAICKTTYRDKTGGAPPRDKKN